MFEQPGPHLLIVIVADTSGRYISVVVDATAIQDVFHRIVEQSNVFSAPQMHDGILH